MADDIQRCAAWLERMGVRKGHRVALHVYSAYRHWVLFFAVEAIGGVSVAVWSGKPLDQDALSFVGADHFITSLQPVEPLTASGQVLDTGWLARLRKTRLRPSHPHQRTEADPICIVLSSGTTGTPKKVLFTREMLDRRVFTPESADLVNATSRVFLDLPIVTIGALTMALNTWSVGGTLCTRTAEMPMEAMLRRYDPTLIAGAPAHYAQILASLPESFEPKRPIHAAVGGGTLTPALNAGVRKRLRGGVTMIYGSTEMGYVTRGDDLPADDERAVGHPWRWTELEIRDDTGLTASMGEIGEVWVRGEHVITGFLDDDGADGGFKDGWFHPGDLGSLREDGTLMLHGRTDDLMNVQGFKMLPSSIEAAVRETGLVEDVAVLLARHPSSGEKVIWIICVADRPFADEAVAQAIPRRANFTVAFVDAIPRNPMGKIERAVLRQQAEAGDLRVSAHLTA